jgi:hypothetical protein
MKNRILLVLMVNLVITSVIAQKVIDNKIPIKMLNLPNEVLDTTYQSYLVEIIYPDNIKYPDDIVYPIDKKYPGLKELINTADISGSIVIPRYQKLNTVSEEGRKNLGIIVTIKFSEYEHTWTIMDDKLVADKHYWCGAIKMRVTVSWNYPHAAFNNFTYEFNYNPNLEANLNFKSEGFIGIAKTYENRSRCIISSSEEILDALKSNLREKCQRFYPSIRKGYFINYTLSDKKTDLTKTDEILEVVKRGIGLIDSTDIFANPSAAKELNVAIGMYDELIADVRLAKMKYVLLNLYLNKQNLELITGNYTAAEQTYLKYKKEVGTYMIVALKSKDDMRFDRYKCDMMGLAYK